MAQFLEAVFGRDDFTQEEVDAIAERFSPNVPIRALMKLAQRDVAIGNCIDPVVRDDLIRIKAKLTPDKPAESPGCQKGDRFKWIGLGRKTTDGYSQAAPLIEHTWLNESRCSAPNPEVVG